MATLDEERRALRLRLGAGARWDSPAAPSDTLRLARIGTAYFARLLNNLTDRELNVPSLVEGWTRRHVVSQVGYQARALTRLTKWAATGVRTDMYASQEARLNEVNDGSTLPAEALRGLFRHAAVHLDVEWRDLDAAAWDAPLQLPDGRFCTARLTPWLRAREVWLRSIDLDSGASFRDLPRDVVNRLSAEATCCEP